MDRRLVISLFLIGALALLIVLQILPSAPNSPTVKVTMVKDGWAGYVARAREGYAATFVNGSWTVPRIDCSSGPNSAVLIWVGLDGNGSIEQIGTRSDCTNGIPTYGGWYEFWPLQSITVTIIGFKANPGDNVSASVGYSNSTKLFSLTMSDGRSRSTFSLDTTYSRSSVGSAEWIVEAPELTNGARLPLSNFSRVQFVRGFATIGAHTQTIAGLSGGEYSDLFEMTYDCNNVTRAQPGPLTDNAADFTVSWASGGDCSPPGGAG